MTTDMYFRKQINPHTVLWKHNRVKMVDTRRKETRLRGFANNKGADQPAHPRSLISAFVIRFFRKYQYVNLL